MPPAGRRWIAARSWLGTPVPPLARAGLALVAGGLSVALFLGTTQPPLASLRAASLVLLAVATVAAANALAARVLGMVSLCLIPERLALSFSAAWTLSFALVDRVHHATFARHLDLAQLTLGARAVAAGVLRVSWVHVALFCGALALATGMALVLLFLLGRVRAPVAAERLARHAAIAAMAAALFGALFRDELFDPSRGDDLAAAFPWTASGAAPRVAAEGETDLGESLDERTFAKLLAQKDELLSGPLAAASTPDILFVHVESLRHDVVVPAMMPRLSALAAHCLAPAHAYANSNNTGGGVFGATTGLAPAYYPLARRARARSLPISVLRRLGYEAHSWFSGNFATYDDIFEIVFAGLVDLPPSIPADDAWRNDERLVARYLETLDAPARAPRFDYLVLDSTHFDYSYPPTFERFTPAETMGPAIKEGAQVFDVALIARIRQRAPLIKNRYLNSATWADALLGRLLDGLAARGRLERTVLVVFGDHGEAFWEHDVFGHGTALSEEQTRVPIVICAGDGLDTRYAYASHADVFPTVFARLGLSGVRVPFWSGKSLLSYDRSRDVAVVGAGVTGTQSNVRFTVVSGGLKVGFSNERAFPIWWVRDEHDVPVAAPRETTAALVARALDAKLLR